MSKDQIREEMDNLDLVRKVLINISRVPIREVTSYTLSTVQRTTQATILRQSGIYCKFVDATAKLPQRMMVKKYHNESRRDEFEREQGMLIASPKCVVGGALITAYPDIYSAGIAECDKRMYIFRESIPEDTIDKEASRDFGYEEFKNIRKDNGYVEWGEVPEDVRKAIAGPLWRVGLIHAKSKDLETLLPNVKEVSTDTAFERFYTYLSELYTSKKSKDILEKKKDQIRAAMEPILEYAWTDKKFSSIINGDLDVFPNHVTSSRLLDAGSTERSSLVRDLGLYGDPSFSSISDIELAVAEEYLKAREIFADRFSFEKFDKSKEDVAMRSCAVNWIGNIRRARSIKKYKKDEFEDKDKLNKALAKHLARGYEFLGKVWREGPKKLRDEVERVVFILDNLDVAEGYKTLIWAKNGKDTNRGNGNGSKSTNRQALHPFAGSVTEVKATRSETGGMTIGDERKLEG